MGSQCPLKLPIIDFSELSVGCPKWDLVKAQVRQALKEYGCFEALFPDSPLDLRKALFRSLEELFNLPSETKLKNSSKRPYHGYIGKHPVMPLYETLHIQDPLVPEKVEALMNLFWPQGNADFAKLIQSYSKQLSELDQTVRRMVLESLCLEDYVKEHMDSTNYLLRVMKYQGPKTTETKLGLTPHADDSTLTILYQNQVDGLQVQTKDGEWINATPSKDSFIVMIGLSLEAGTNGRFYAPTHRVMMSGDEPRYSAGLFSLPKEGYMIKAPEKLIDENHPLLFKPFDHVKFVEYFYSWGGQMSQSALEIYCGV